MIYVMTPKHPAVAMIYMEFYFFEATQMAPALPQRNARHESSRLIAA